MAFDLEAAFKAGATEDDVLGHLTRTRSYDVDGALKAGASKRDVINYLATTPPKNRGPVVPGMEKLGPLPGPAGPKVDMQPRSLGSAMMPNGYAQAQQQTAEMETTGNRLAGQKLAEYSPIEGVPQMYRGAKEAFGPGRTRRQRAAGMTDMIRGGGKSIAPVALPIGLATNPVATGLAIAGGIAATEGVSAGLKAADVAPEYADLAGEFAGLVPLGAGAAAVRSALKPKVTSKITYGGELPPPPVDAGPVPKGPIHPASESAAVLAQEFPPVVKPARESAQVFMENELPPLMAPPEAPRPSTAAEAAEVLASAPKSAAESAAVLQNAPELPSLPPPVEAPVAAAGPKSAEESAKVFLDNLVRDAGPVPKGPKSAAESAEAFRPDKVSITIRPDDPRSTVAAVRDIMGVQQQKPPELPPPPAARPRVKAITEPPKKAPETPQQEPSTQQQAPIAQQAEPVPLKDKVEGSSPSGGSTTTDVGKVGQDPEVAVMPISQIREDPARFQFRSHDVDRLEGVEKYDKSRGGVLSVWRDPGDGQVYVVNGHNRLRKARQLGEQQHRVQFLDAPDAEAARIQGALINIAENSASPVDVAKVFRSQGMDQQVLKSIGFSPKQKLVQQGVALSRLSDDVFTKVATGEIPVERAVVVGDMVKDPSQQTAALSALARAERGGKNLTEGEAREAVRFALASPTSTQDDLFGSFEVNRFAEMGQVSDYIKSRMANEKRLFSTVANAKAADKLGKAGNKIKADTNAQVAEQLAQARELYDKLATSSGPVNQALQSAALQLAESGGKNGESVKSAAYDAIRPILESEWNRIFAGRKGAPKAAPGRVPEAPTQDAGAGAPDAGGSGAGPSVRPGGPGGVADAAADAAKPPREFSSTQVDLPVDVANRVRDIGARIPKALLAEDGVETNPHVTVKFGLHGNNPEDVRPLLAGEGPVKVRIKGVSIFDNPEFDVVKLDVDSPDLHRLNKKISDALPHTDTHPTYQPHITIAYVKKGEGKKLAEQIGAELKGTEIALDSLTYSGKDRVKTAIPLRGRSADQPAQQSLVTAAEESTSRAQAKEDAGRLQAQQATQEIQFGKGKRLDTGKESIEDSPLFGGPRQGSMFDNPERGSIKISPSTVKAVKEKTITARTQLTDEFAAIENFTKEFGLKHEDDPYRGARMFAGVGGRIENRLNDLGEILRPAKQEGLLEDIKQYALYERYEELAGRGINRFPDGKDIATIQAEKLALEQALGPQKLQQVQAHIAKLRSFMDGLLTEAKQGGIISDSAYNAIKAKNQKYIPLQRMEYLADQLDKGIAGGSDSFSVAGQDLVKTIYGSEKSIVDPLESIVRNIYKTETLIARNKVANQMAALAKNPQTGVSPLPKSGAIPKGMDKFSALQNGVKREYIAPTPVVDAMKRLNEHQMDLVTKAARLSSRALRAGATTFNIPFAIRNIFRDFQSAAINSPVGFSPVDWLKGMAEALKRGDDYRQFLEDGGSLSGYFERNKALPNKVKDLTMGKGEKLVKGYVLKPWELIRLVGETSELAPRLGAYKRAKAKGKSGEEAAYIGRNVTVDFAKSGAAMKVFNLWVPFMNARLQGSINTALAFRDRPLRSTMTAGAMIGMPALLTYAHNVNNHREVWDDIAQFEKDNNFLVIYGDERDKDGNPTQVVKIAKGEVGKILGNPLENFMEYMRGANPRNFKQVLLQVASDVSPVGFEREGEISGGAVISSTFPPAAKGLVEGYTNVNTYTGRQIVPETMRDASPGEQYYKNDSRKPDTPEWLVKLGKYTDISPLKWQNFMGTQFGSVGRQASELPSLGRVGAAIKSSVLGARGGEKDVQTKKGVQEAVRADADERLRETRIAGEIFKALEALPPEQRGPKLEEFLDREDVTDEVIGRLDKMITKQEKTAGISIPEYILQRSSSNARAIHILNRMRVTPDERLPDLLDEFEAKGILTPDVEEALVRRMERESAAAAQ